MLSMLSKWRRGVVVITTAQLHLAKLNSGSAQVQILLSARQRFEMVRISDKAKRLLSVNHTRKAIHHYQILFEVLFW